MRVPPYFYLSSHKFIIAKLIIIFCASCHRARLVLCEIAWVLEAMRKQSEIKLTLEKILSYESLEVVGFDEDDLLVGEQHADIPR